MTKIGLYRRSPATAAALIWLAVVATLVDAAGRRRLRSDGGDGELVARWMCKIRGGSSEAQRLAERRGLVLLGKVGSTRNVFEYGLPEEEGSNRHRRRRDVEEVDVVLEQETTVVWYEQERALIRVNRDTPSFQNPLYRSTWTASSPVAASSQSESEHANFEPVYMNVVPVWGLKITGKGAVVSILDDGLERTHPDIKENYDPLASYDFNGRDPDPIPRYDRYRTNRHGTRCAGVVAAAASGKSVCGAPGIAYNARLGGIRMLDGLLTDATEANALSYNQQHIDIYTVSWGPNDNGQTLEGPSREARRALERGAQKGRNGKGSIFVWAAGNGGGMDDSCACDGYVNSIYTLGISAVDFTGKAPWYTESCTSIMAVAFSSGTTGKSITTTDLNETCTSSHSGTSAAAPLAAGVVALALEANSLLTWRDVQYLTVLTSKKTDPLHSSWKQNGANFSVSSRYGFGLLDAYAFVRTAQRWKRVPEQRMCPAQSKLTHRHFSREKPLKIQLRVDGCQGTPIAIKYLEHVEAKLSVSHPSRGDVEITLVSPAGTRSVLLPYRPRDKSTRGFVHWSFVSVHYWGEDATAEGVWTMEVRDKGSHCVSGSGRCRLDGAFFKFYGVNERPYDDDVVFREPSTTDVDSTVTATSLSTLEIETSTEGTTTTTKPTVEYGDSTFPKDTSEAFVDTREFWHWLGIDRRKR